MKTTIEHLGQTLTTAIFDKDMTDEECDAIRKEFFKKPPEQEVIEQMMKVKRKGNKHTKINKFFFYDLLTNAKIHTSKWSVQEYMKSNDLIRHASARIKKHLIFLIMLTMSKILRLYWQLALEELA